MAAVVPSRLPFWRSHWAALSLPFHGAPLPPRGLSSISSIWLGGPAGPGLQGLPLPRGLSYPRWPPSLQHTHLLFKALHSVKTPPEGLSHVSPSPSLGQQGWCRSQPPPASPASRPWQELAAIALLGRGVQGLWLAFVSRADFLSWLLESWSDGSAVFWGVWEQEVGRNQRGVFQGEGRKNRGANNWGRSVWLQVSFS